MPGALPNATRSYLWVPPLARVCLRARARVAKPCRAFGPERLSAAHRGPGDTGVDSSQAGPGTQTRAGTPPRTEGPNRGAPILPLGPESRVPHPAAHGHRIDARWVGSIPGFGVSQRSKPLICWAAPGMSSPWRCSSLGRPPLVAQTAAPVGGPSPAQCSLMALSRRQRSLARTRLGNVQNWQ
jgi:hypothetical protein